MATLFRKFLKGIRLVPNTTTQTTQSGDVDFSTDTNKINIHNGTTSSPAVTESHSATLTNKNLSDSTVVVVDSVDSTKQIKFDAGGTTGTSTTITGAQTANRVLTLPDETDTVAGVSATQTLTNKTLSGNTATNLVSGAGTLTLNTSGTVTLPNTTDTLVGKNTTDTLTNKSIDGATNTFTNIPNSATTATASATASTIVSRDGSANTALNKVIVNTGAGNGLDVPSAGNLEIGATVGANNITVGSSGSTVIIPGNVTVQGTTTNINTTNLNVTDKNISVNVGGTDASSEGAGLTVDRNPGTDGSIIYKDASATKWALGLLGSEVDVVGTSSTQTLTNKTLTGNTAANLISGSGTLTLNTTGTITVPNATDTLVGKTTTDTLTNKTLTSAFANLIEFSQQGSTPSNPGASASRLYFKTDGNLYKLSNAGAEIKIGSGAGGINYIGNSDFEGGTTGWAAYADAAQSTPVDGTGGSPNVTITQQTVSPLRDSANGIITKDAANRQGQGVSYDFSIAIADQAKVINVSFDYRVSTNYTTGDIGMFVYDVTNATVIQVAPSGVEKLTAALPGKFTGTFQTASNSTSYRLIFHVASTSASSYTLEIDNVVVGPQIVENGAPVTDWVSYTPTGVWTGTYTGKWRRVGDTMEVDVSFAATGAVSGTQTFSIPSGYTIDTTKLAVSSPSNENTALGFCRFADTGTADYPGSVVYSSSTSVQVFTILASGTYAQDDTATATKPFTWGSGDKLTAKFWIPITGWSSTVLMSNETDTRVVSAVLSSGTATLTSSYSDVSFTASRDTHGAFNGTTTYTIPVPGYYKFAVQTRFSSSGAITATNAIGLQLLKNGSAAKTVNDAFLATTAQWVNLVYEEYFLAGDTIKLQAKNQNASPTFDVAPQLYIEKLTGPSAIAATETVAAKYTGSVNAAISSTQPIQWGTKEFDTHNAVTTGTNWKFTAPISGIYEVKACASSTTGTGVNTFIYKNGTITNTIMLAINATTNSNGSGLIKLLAGEYIDIRPGTSLTANAVTEAHVSIIRVGNY